jgi:hypothetical protein
MEVSRTAQGKTRLRFGFSPKQCPKRSFKPSKAPEAARQPNIGTPFSERQQCRAIARKKFGLSWNAAVEIKDADFHIWPSFRGEQD